MSNGIIIKQYRGVNSISFDNLIKNCRIGFSMREKDFMKLAIYDPYIQINFSNNENQKIYIGRTYLYEPQDTIIIKEINFGFDTPNPQNYPPSPASNVYVQTEIIY